jgi:hypothetical protein
VYKAVVNDEPAQTPRLHRVFLPALSSFIVAGAAAIQPGPRLDACPEMGDGRLEPNRRFDQGNCTLVNALRMSCLEHSIQKMEDGRQGLTGDLRLFFRDKGRQR